MFSETRYAMNGDPALVIRYFGSKESLFLEALPVQGFWDDVLAGPLDALGVRLVEFVLSRASDQMLRIHTTLVRASDSPAVRARLYEIVDHSFVDVLKDRLPGPDPVLLARLIAAQVGGLLQSLSISDEGLRDYDRPTIVAAYGRAIQSIVGVECGVPLIRDRGTFKSSYIPCRPSWTPSLRSDVMNLNVGGQHLDQCATIR